MEGQMTEKKIEEIAGLLTETKLPDWEELPDLELYMDQVLALIERFLGAYPGMSEKSLTSSMVNNYVKLGVIPPPVKKRYSREHVARLLVICLLKAVLPIPVIGEITNGSGDFAEYYRQFSGQFELTAKDCAEAAIGRRDEAVDPVCAAALRAQAEQALALSLYQARKAAE